MIRRVHFYRIKRKPVCSHWVIPSLKCGWHIISSLQVRAGLSNVPRGFLISSTSIFMEFSDANTSSMPSASSRGASACRKSSMFSWTLASCSISAPVPPLVRSEFLLRFLRPSRMGSGSIRVAAEPWKQWEEKSWWYLWFFLKMPFVFYSAPCFLWGEMRLLPFMLIIFCWKHAGLVECWLKDEAVPTSTPPAQEGDLFRARNLK